MVEKEVKVIREGGAAIKMGCKHKMSTKGRTLAIYSLTWQSKKGTNFRVTGAKYRKVGSETTTVSLFLNIHMDVNIFLLLY